MHVDLSYFNRYWKEINSKYYSSDYNEIFYESSLIESPLLSELKDVSPIAEFDSLLKNLFDLIKNDISKYNINKSYILSFILFVNI